MNDALTTRQAVTVILMLLALRSITTGGSKTTNEETKWSQQLQQYGWDPKELVNKVEHGDVTTFELGTPNYQILNPEDEPEYITEDQPHYKEWLRRLTSNPNASQTIDMTQPSTTSNDTATEDNAPSHPTGEKLQKRSFKEPAEETAEEETSDMESAVEEEVGEAAHDKRSIHPKIKIYAGARPFQKSIANLS